MPEVSQFLAQQADTSPAAINALRTYCGVSD
jgi:hypothetical protein